MNFFFLTLLLGLLFSGRGSQSVFRKQTNFFNLMETFLILNFSEMIAFIASMIKIIICLYKELGNLSNEIL